MSKKTTKKETAKKTPKKKIKPILNPATSVDHDLKNYYIQVELPGVKKEDVTLNVTEQSFCVQGVREDIDFLGCFVLAHPVNGEKAKAKFENGLLGVIIPLKKHLMGKKIPIE
jgi:HSP20 family protein